MTTGNPMFLLTHHRLSAALLLILFALAGCNHGHDHDASDIDPVGPHGGVILVTDDPNVFVEYLHQPRENRVVLYVLDRDRAAVPSVTEPPLIDLVVDGRPDQLETAPVPETPGAFQATHESFAGEDFRAQAHIHLPPDRTLTVELVEPHGHHHHH